MKEKILCPCVAWFGSNLNFLRLKMDDILFVNLRILGQTTEHVLI